jgi:uncharacterized BrkB/YihY/UPF0761 family membrane protein
VLFNAIQRPLDWLGLDGGLFEEMIRHGIPLIFTTVVVLLLYRFVPARKLRFGAAFAGAIVTALLMLAISLVSAVIYDRTRSLSLVYGSLTVALIFLYSVYLYASALLLGAEVAAAWSRPAEATEESIQQQLRRAVLGLFINQDPPLPPARRPRVPTDPP